MEVPKYVKKAIKDCAEAEYQARLNEKMVIEWLEKHNLTEETAKDVERNMDDAFIDCCKLGYAPDDFIQILEDLKEE